MRTVLHVSSECYPAAKAGGMGDVVGALPSYLPEHGVLASVVIPKYKNKWFEKQTFIKVYAGTFKIGGKVQKYTIERLKSGTLQFPFYCINLPGLFDRASIYLAEDGNGYQDEPKRNIAFQTAVLEWLIGDNIKFDLLHLHDHMTGLIPFFMQYGEKYNVLKNIPTLFTIHNGMYRGEFKWGDVQHLLPEYNGHHSGLLDWDGKINSLAAAIKCAWSINTVSPAYMTELMNDSDTLIPLYKSEKKKCTGILNGIDDQLWDPENDTYLTYHLKGDWKKFKSSNKAYILKRFGLMTRRPLFGFIGRFAYQKGADILFEALNQCMQNKLKISAIILGSGDKALEQAAKKLNIQHYKEIGIEIAYDEQLARHIYAGSDFLLMPSRFEPCGLNQMYAMRYGTIPIASHVGGLKDTVVDINNNGQGIVIEGLTATNIVESISRAVDLYKNKVKFNNLINQISSLDYSWDYAASQYTKLYIKHIK